jgi:hypothetical protein
MIETLLAVTISASVACNNQNFEQSVRCNEPVDYFVVEDNGEAWGYLVNGIQFTQRNVVNEYTRLQRFQLEDAFWYVSDRGIIRAESDLQALSIYVSM